MGLKDRLNAALERANAGRQAKLGAKSDVAAKQGNLKKAAKLDMRSQRVALRGEKRQAISDAKNTMKIGKALGKINSYEAKGSPVKGNEPLKPYIPSAIREAGAIQKFDTPRSNNPIYKDVEAPKKKNNGGPYNY